jgi:hypothetical protein
MMKNRNRSKPTTARNMKSRTKEKFTTNAGIIAGMGTMRETRYRLFGQNRPLARLEKSFGSPSLAIFFERIFRPDMQSEFLDR